VNWLAAAPTSGDLAALAAVYPTVTGSRAARLLADLAKSAEIFGYYRRAEAGEFVGLYNNTVREQVLKQNFLERYRAVDSGRGLPRAMFKFGSNHLYHGRNPTQAFPIGNLAHEMAIANGAEAFGLFVIFLGDGYRSYQDYPAWLRTLLPANAPLVPTLVDLRALRPYQRLFREQVPAPRICGSNAPCCTASTRSWCLPGHARANGGWEAGGSTAFVPRSPGGPGSKEPPSVPAEPAAPRR
jgi:hypothetical protein